MYNKFTMRLQTNIEKFFINIFNILQKLHGRVDARFGFKTTLIISLAIFLLSALFTTYESTSSQRTNGDQFISGAIFGNIAQGIPMVSSVHTNLLKMPFLLIEGISPQNINLYVLINTILISVAVIAWAILISVMLGKKYAPLIIMCFAALLISSPNLSINLSMITIRHIEYPLALLYLLLIVKFLNYKKRHLLIALLLSIYLSILIVNDGYFLYTLAPSALLATLLYKKKNRSDLRQLIYALSSICLGVLLSFVFIKVLNMTGLISLSTGYASTHQFIAFNDIGKSISLTISQTLDLFGSLFFGQDIRKSNIFLLLGFLMVITISLGIYRTIRTYKNPSHPIHIYLLLLMSFVYLSYIIPGFVNVNNARYLTLIVFIGTVYFADIIIYWTKKHPSIYNITIILLIILACIAIPKNLSFYQQINSGIDRDVARTELTSQLLKENNVPIVVTSGGHFSLWFYSKKELTIVQLESECNTPSQWANNSYWLKPTLGAQKSAFLVDRSYPEKASSNCDINTVEGIYGKPEKVVSVPKPGESKENITTYLLIYDYDIRSRLQ